MVVRLFFSQLRMVFRSDPRAGYGKFDFNVEWFYQYLDEKGEELVPITTNPVTGYEFCEDELLSRETRLNKYLETAMDAWIGYCVFGNKAPRIILYQEFDLSCYNDVWGFLYDVMLHYLDKNPDHFTLRDVE